MDDEWGDTPASMPWVTVLLAALCLVLWGVVIWWALS